MWFNFTTLRTAGPRISTVAAIWRRGVVQYLTRGCGTGVLATALARKPDCFLVGVDPAAAMLALVKQRCGAASVSWVLTDARTIRLNRRFELVLLSGHAFQVFLTADDQAAAHATVATHLPPEGRSIVDSCSPTVEAWKRWTPLKRNGSSSTRASARSPRERRVARSGFGHRHLSNLLPDHRGGPGPLLSVANRVSIARTTFYTDRGGRFGGRALDGRLVRSAVEPTSGRDHPAW
jgi:hypothetical protein